MRKGQVTLLNIVMILLTLFFLAFTAGLWYPILNNILGPALNNGVDGGMGASLALLIFPLLIIILIVMIWLWARPLV
jgi:hypothetical protein